MSDKMREEFEAWALGKGRCLNRCKSQDYYRSASTSALWRAWQDSRQAIKVKLPDWDNYDTTKQVLIAVAEELDAAGVRYE